MVLLCSGSSIVSYCSRASLHFLGRIADSAAWRFWLLTRRHWTGPPSQHLLFEKSPTSFRLQTDVDDFLTLGLLHRSAGSAASMPETLRELSSQAAALLNRRTGSGELAGWLLETGGPQTRLQLVSQLIKEHAEAEQATEEEREQLQLLLRLTRNAASSNQAQLSILLVTLVWRRCFDAVS